MPLPLVLLATLVHVSPATVVDGSAAASVCVVTAGSHALDRSEIDHRAAALGYPEVIEVEMEDGCVHIEARTRDGRIAEVILHPVTAAVIRAEIED